MQTNLRAPRSPLHQNPRAVRQARIARDLTQVALADKLDITQGYLSEIERGSRSAPPELLERIAQVLTCPVASLQRRRPLACPSCTWRHDPAGDGLVPLHQIPDTDKWCPAGGAPESQPT